MKELLELKEKIENEINILRERLKFQKPLTTERFSTESLISQKQDILKIINFLYDLKK